MSYQFEEEAGRIVLKDQEGKEAGEITFTREGDDVIIIDHTGVEQAHRGQGLAGELVNKVVEKAKEENLKVMPVCPFAKKQFEEHTDYQAVQQ